ncbi:Reeler domain-containing protein [Hyperthermus butylicus]|uniref:Reelin domain-containing protein n=1 Tax=Hyperthermus butylicus (strain DSM 5456 / JCM 9403 / PLM1-5) TaxID=415426 RepID=A2BMJ0_HYPBU|nr:Reeler domain-containing protein [Hyperthermus butylicus]ABM81201.1 hypothetical protein Hbut_1376 [Hyperthermus butylicus DSM 5456]
MRKLVVVLGLVALILVFGIAAYRHAEAMSNGAPQLNCLQCHQSAAQNPVDFTITGLPQNYQPGKTYTITIKINNGPDCSSGVACGGFAVVVDAGELIASDSKNTFISGEILTHTKDGSMLREWTFQWKAPENPVPVTFNISVIAANGDGTFNGDAFGNKVIKIEPAKAAEEEPAKQEEEPSTTTTTTTTTTTRTVTTVEKTEHNLPLAIAVAVVIFVVVVAGYLLLARK